MKAYLDIARHILENGEWKENRTGIRTLTTFCEIFRHNMADGFPLLTTKKMPLKTIAVELEGFINGITSKQWYKDRGCNIWNQWCNPKKIPYSHDKTIQEKMALEDDLGYVYGYMWRNFSSKNNNIVSLKKPDNPNYINKVFPSNPTICGIAVKGNPKQTLAVETEKILYKNWYDMINRCYNSNCSQYNFYGRKDCKVDDRWLIYENYRNDIERILRWQDKMREPKKYHLDKDYYGYNYYGPQTCIYLNYKENILYNSSSLYQIENIMDGTKYLFLSKEEAGKFLNFSRKSIDTYLDKEKLFEETYKVTTASQDGYLYRYQLPCDQLKNVIETLKKDPNDRRMVVSAWEPPIFPECALMPCHYAFTLVHINGRLNLCWKQRSCDLFLGVPFNIASYAMLLQLICQTTNLIPGELVGILEDCHIYENHIKQTQEQISREPKKLPTINIQSKDIFSWTHKDIELINYDSHSRIYGKVAV